jgi:hypothetical protein
LTVLMRLLVSRSVSLFWWCVLHCPRVGLLLAVASSTVFVLGFGKLREAGGP